MSKYVEVLGSVCEPSRAASTALTTVMGAGTLENISGGQNGLLDLALGVAGGFVGRKLWKQHKNLGMIAGFAVGANANELVRGDRRNALISLGVIGGATAASLAWKKHAALGWAGGFVSALAVSSYIPGSPMQQAYARAQQHNAEQDQIARVKAARAVA